MPEILQSRREHIASEMAAVERMELAMARRERRASRGGNFIFNMEKE